MAAYSPLRHAWDKSDDITDVDRFFIAAGKLWSWSQARGELAAAEGGGWRRDPLPWREVAYDQGRLVLLDAGGNVVVRDQSGERTLVTAPERPLPLSSAADIAAAGELQDRLFIATKSGAVIAYEGATHRWQPISELSGVVEFAAPADDRSGLFARTANGELWRFDPAATVWRHIDLPTRQVVALAQGSAMIALTVEGQVFALDGAGRTIASYRPVPFGGGPAGNLTIAAAQEAGGSLLLVARVNDGSPRLLAYLPGEHRWQSLDSVAEPAYFLKAGSDLWLAERRAGEFLLQRITSGGDGHPAAPALEAASGPYREVSANGAALVALRGGPQHDTVLEQVTAGGAVPLQIADAALPAGRQVITATGVGADCVVLLDDGAIEHYTPERRWVERLGPSAGKPGSFTLDPGDGEPRLLRPGRQPLRWRADRQSWVEQDEAAGAPSAPPADQSGSLAASGAAVPGRSCRVAAPPPALVFERTIAGGQQRLALKGSRLDFDTVEQAFLRADRLYLVTPAGTRRFVQQQDSWREEIEALPAAARPEPDPLTFSGERFSAALDPTGSFRSTAGPLWLTMLVADGNRLNLAPVLGGQGIALAHDDIRSVFESGATVYAATGAGVARLARSGGVFRLAAIDGPAQGVARADIVRVGRAAGRVVAIDRSGAAFEQVSDTGRWRDAAAGTAIEEPPPPLAGWQLARNAGAVRLLRGLPGAGSVAVSLSERGFGFDRIWAVGCGANEVHLYTDDGLVRPADGEPYKDLPNLDPGLARPYMPAGAAEVVEAASDGRAQVWARTQAGVWRHDGQAWRGASAQDFAQAVERRQPMLWDDGTTTWSRDDTVGVTLAHGRATLRFDPGNGRFDADRPTAIAADRAGLAALTPAGVVRYGADFAWQSISWPEGRANGPASLFSDPARVLLQTGDSWFGWSEAGWVPLAGAELDGIARSKDFLLDGRFWRVSRRAGAPDIEMRIAQDGPFSLVRIGADGRFDFETTRDIVAASGGLWAATDFGMVQLDPTTHDIRSLQPTGRPAVRLVPDGGGGAQLDGGVTLAYRDGKWQPDASSEVFAEADRRVVDGGPWHWTRLASGPKVLLDPGGADGLWHGTAPLEVGFAGNRFAFDAVRDAAIADRPWLATAAGLIGRSGALSAQIDPPVPGTLAEGDGWSGVFAVAAPVAAPTLFARINGQIAMLADGQWRPAPEAVVGDGSVLRDHAVRTADYAITQADGHVQVSVRLPDDPPDRYVPAVFDPLLRRFSHDMPNRITRDPSPSKPGLLLATPGGVLAANIDRKAATRLYAEPSSDGIGTEEIKALAYLPKVRRSLALLADGRIKRLDAGGTSWADAETQDAQLLHAARHVPFDDPDGWGVEVADNAAPRLFWRHQPAILVAEPPGSGQAGGSTRFAHDVARSAYIAADAIVVGTRGGIVRIPVTEQGNPAPARFTLRAADILSPDELAGRTPPRGIGFLRPDPSGGSVYARRESDGRALQISAAGVEVVADGDAELAASEIVARDPAWTWSKSSGAPVQMTPSEVFHVPAGYNFLGGRTWSFLDIEQGNRRFPHRAMVRFRDDLFVATAGGVARFAAPAPHALTGTAPEDAAPQPFIAAVYAQVRGRGAAQPMVNVVELYVTQRQQLMARTGGGEFFAFDPDHDDWYPAPPGANPAAELWRVADTPLLDWRFDETGRQTIVVRPLLQDMPDQSAYPIFVNGRFAFDDVHATLAVGDALWLATGGGVCVYNRSDFAPRRFIMRPFLEAAGAAKGDARPLGLVRELVRDPDRRDRLVARTDRGAVLEADATAEFHPTAAAVTDGLDVFERAYTRETPGAANHQMRLVQYPFGSYRLPQGALRARFRDAAGAWVELGRNRDEVALPLFSHERFAFDDVSDAVLHDGRLLVTTPVGIVTHGVDWDAERATILSIDAADDKPAPGQLPALHDMIGIVGMPNGTVLAWNADRVFQMSRDGGRTFWHDQRKQGQLPVQRLQVLDEETQVWQISLGPSGAGEASITRLVGGRAEGEIGLGAAARFSDVSHPATDRKWIYVPRASYGLVQVEKAKIR